MRNLLQTWNQTVSTNWVEKPDNTILHSCAILWTWLYVTNHRETSIKCLLNATVIGKSMYNIPSNAWLNSVGIYVSLLLFHLSIILVSAHCSHSILAFVVSKRVLTQLHNLTLKTTIHRSLRTQTCRVKSTVDRLQLEHEKRSCLRCVRPRCRGIGSQAEEETNDHLPSEIMKTANTQQWHTTNATYLLGWIGILLKYSSRLEEQEKKKRKNPAPSRVRYCKSLSPVRRGERKLPRFRFS